MNRIQRRNCSQWTIAILIAFGLFVGVSVSHAESDALPDCVESGEHDAVTYLLVDRSDEIQNTQNLEQSLLIARKMIGSGERLIVGVITGQASETRVIMDLGRPKESLWVSKLKIRAQEKKFDDCFLQMKERVIKPGEKHKTSAILETLQVVSKVMATDAASKKRVVVYSDMVQNSSQISFYQSKKFDPAAELKRVEADRLLPIFAGTEFHVAGAGSHQSDERAKQVEEFWTLYFKKSQASLKFYGPVLFGS